MLFQSSLSPICSEKGLHLIVSFIMAFLSPLWLMLAEPSKGIAERSKDIAELSKGIVKPSKDLAERSKGIVESSKGLV